jgi:formylglycine-generating enzyme required for sulfatase activity
MIIVAVIALIGIGAAWFFLMHAAPETEGLSEQSAVNSESYHAIRDFLAADDWSDEQIANFNTRWATLPDEMRNAALDQPWYQDFVERVRSQVKERRALTATADSAGTVEGPLSALASSVGIDISSPDTVLPVRINTSSSASGGSAAEASKTGSLQKTSAQAPAHESPADATAPAKTSATAATVAQAGRPAASGTSPAAASSAKKPAQDVPDASPDRCRIEMANARKPRCRDALNIGGFGPYLAVYRAGEFEMGSKEASQEQPVHRVRIAKPFAIAEFEASQAEYQLFCSETRRACESQPWTGEDLPVVRVNWQDARDYVEWLSAVSGKSYRLATEAEWEFAARNGGSALFPSGEALAQTDAVFSGVEKHSAPWPRSEKINANVPKTTNTPQLYHSIGNVREWVEDAWSTSYAGAPDDGSARKTADSALRVVRGGAYDDAAPKLRFTTREGLDPSTRDATTGFRVVREF